jgi:F-type H+-transporting ATPase subunit b
VYLLALTGGAGHLSTLAAAAAAEPTGLTINVFWVIVSAVNFIVFATILWYFGFRRLTGVLDARKARIDEGLADAEQARKDREAGVVERERVINEARREASALVAASQQAAQQLREADIAATKAELERMREKALADIAAERDRALAELRGQVADLALEAAGKVVGETMSSARQRRLVEDFLSDDSAVDPRRAN